MFRTWSDALATLTLWLGLAVAIWALVILALRAILS